MMNNQFNTTNISTQHGIQMAQHVTTSPPQASTAVLNSFLTAQQQQQQQLAAAVAAGAIYSDPRQLQLNSNSIDKNYYTTTAATLGAMGTPQRFYTTAGPATAAGATNPIVNASTAHHPNTILITNNFSHQQPGQSLSPDHQRSVRIVTSASNPLNSTNSTNLATTASGFQHAQHVFNLNNNKQLQHLFPQHLLHQTSFQPATTTELLQQHFATQHFPSSQQQQPQQNHTASSIQMPQFYVSSENTITSPLNSNQKIITNIVSNSATPGADNAATTPLVGNGSNPNSSTVVLDRINICINNLYTDTSSSSSASNSLASTPAQQSSPIIPAIQHKPIIGNGPPLPLTDLYESNVLVIDEPDSTTTATTPHTPPTTPENTPMPNTGNNYSNNNIISTTSSISSPSTSCNYQKLDKSNAKTTTKQSFGMAAQNIEKASQESSDCTENSIRSATTTNDKMKNLQTNNLDQQLQISRNISTSTTISNTPLTPPTPPSPDMTNSNKEYVIETMQTPSAVPAPLFANGEDVFIKRHDDRFYLGTVIDTARNQFLVRFDDKTEVWCEAEEMRKLTSSGNASSTEQKPLDQPMCVACKLSRPDSKVEICERCGRGYHLKCTSETSPGSEIWLCKRCLKPMKLDESFKFTSGDEETEAETETCLHLHYNVESLTWDDNHQTNAEQIYCYCGKSGKFDNNMLQCWRCLNWFHTHCTQKFRGNILRGDCFFVFCCTVCNYGDEYLRRIQANWVDTVHLILYNLSALKKHHKYHHLLKDINPYTLEKRKILPIPKEWIIMPEKEFLDKIKSALIENNQLFMCGKEVKQDIYSFTLRSIEPPIILKFPVKSHDIFNDDLVFSNLKLPLLEGAPENLNYKFLNLNSLHIEITPKSKRKLNEDYSSHDVYEFDDTSEDEIPIKHILDKVKKTKLSPSSVLTCANDPKISNNLNNKLTSVIMLEKMDVEDDNANYTLIPPLPESGTSVLSTPEYKKEQTPKKEGKSSIKSVLGSTNKCNEKSVLPLCEKPKSLNAIHAEKSSRKRKAFTLSKSYNASHIIDTSSDENSSSSSKGTSLDLIIPPPKNFLGQNNPFRIVSPKKNVADVTASTTNSKKSVSFGIFNTTVLNFSSNLAALKSAGLFPKLSTSNLAKAAGQPRTVRTIKRRLSAKDITIGPNKEVRRRRTRRLSSNIEVISTTTINPIPTNFFPIQAKDLLAAAAASTTSAATLFTTTTQNKATASTTFFNNNISTSASSSPNIGPAHTDNTAPPSITSLPSNGRRLRQRPQKNSPNTSRRSSVSSNQSSTSSASVGGVASQNSNPPHQSHEDLKQTVNKYFGIVNRIESGEQFSIRAKRQLSNGQMQYLIEWGEAPMVPIQHVLDHTSNSQLMEITTTT